MLIYLMNLSKNGIKADTRHNNLSGTQRGGMEMEGLASLFREELIFVENAQTQEEIFMTIGKRLVEKGIVKEGFTQAIMEREENYPTGLDLSPVSDEIPNAAIPHTEAEYCNSKNVAFVKLENTIQFKNMIAPDNEIPVKYLFVIINNDASHQTNVLSGLMAFMTDAETMKKLETLTDKKEMYDFLYQTLLEKGEN